LNYKELVKGSYGTLTGSLVRLPTGYITSGLRRPLAAKSDHDDQKTAGDTDILKLSMDYLLDTKVGLTIGKFHAGL
jgi:hypothetical protein